MSIFWDTPEFKNDPILRDSSSSLWNQFVFCTFRFVLLFLYSYVNFPEVWLFFFFYLKELTSRLLFSYRSNRNEPSVSIVNVVSMTSRLFCLFPYMCKLWDLVLQPKKTTKHNTIWKPWHSFASFLCGLYCFKGTLVFFKNLPVLLSTCTPKCLVSIFFPLYWKLTFFAIIIRWRYELVRFFLNSFMTKVLLLFYVTLQPRC